MVSNSKYEIRRTAFILHRERLYRFAMHELHFDLPTSLYHKAISFEQDHYDILQIIRTISKW